jgi:hypothetical protein
MILLSEWASFKKSGDVAPSFEDEEVPLQEDESTITDVVLALVENLQMASRVTQSVAERAEMQSKIDALSTEVTAQLKTELSTLRLIVDQQLTALFSPLLSERLETKAIEDFCNALMAAIGRDASKNLVIAAPMELQDKLRSSLEPLELNVEIVNAEDQEVSTTLDATEIITEIGKWKADLQRLLT